MCCVDGQVRAIDGVALMHETPQRGQIHVGRHTGKVIDQPANHRRAHRPLALLHLHLHFIAQPRSEHLGQLGGHDNATLRQVHRPALGIQQPVQIRTRRHARHRQPSRVRTIAQPRLHRAHRLRADHAGQVLQVVKSAPRSRIGEKRHHVLALRHVPLVSEEVVDAVRHRSRQHHQARGQ